MNIAVTGSTGQLGRLVIDTLVTKVPAADAIALARQPEKAQSLGVPVRLADYDRAATLDTALAGVDTLLLISSSEVGKRASQHDNVIAAAKRAGVKRIVYTSLLHADASALSLADEHRLTEAALKASGMEYTILRNGWYTENYLGSLAAAVQSGSLAGSAGEGKIASASRQDYAEAAVAVLLGAGHENATYELAGDSAWTLSDLAGEVAQQSRRPVTYVDMPEVDYAAALVAAGLPEGLAGAIASWDAAAANGALYSSDKTLSRLIGRPTTPLNVAVAQALKTV